MHTKYLKKGKPNESLRILTAYFTEGEVVLRQESINEKTNEIPLFQEMFKYMDISTMHLHCQKVSFKKTNTLE